MTAVSWFEGASLLSEPAFQLVAGHETEATTELFKTQHICFRCITSVEGGAPHGIVVDPGAAAQADAN